MAPARVEGYRNFATKLWNAAKFAEHYDCKRVEGFDPSAAKETVNRWIATEAARTAEAMTAAIEAYKFNEAAAALYRFIWSQLCDWYLELTKPVLNAEEGPAKEETRATVAWVLDVTLALLHPVMPFITEEIWDDRSGRDGQLLALSPWPAPAFRDEAAAEEMNWAIDLIAAIRSVRSEMNVPAGAMVPVSVAGVSQTNIDRLNTHDVAIRRLARIEAVSLADAPLKGAVQIVIGEATISLPLAGIIDIAAERARLQRELDKIAKEIARIEAKLGNEQFMAKAKEEVVEEQRQRLADALSLRDRMEAALRRLSS
jgi:valyl-tRNA synthetase